MKQLAALLCVGLVTAGASISARAQDGALFNYKGKAVTSKELSPALQQTLHDMEAEHFLRVQAFADQVVYDTYVDFEVKKQGKPRAEVEEALFPVKEPTDKELSDWYEANKSRIPPNYKLEQISGEIKNVLKGEGRKAQRDVLLVKLKKEGNLTLAIKEPEAPLFKIEAEGFPRRGPATAKVAIVEFADYQCPHCKHVSEALERIIKKNEGKVSVVYLDFPIKGEGSNQLAYGGYCAEQQGKFWEFHDMAFAKQGAGAPDPKAIAKEIKLDDAKFAACLTSPEPAKRVAKSKAEGERIGISGTPAIFLNGRRVRGIEEKDLEAEVAKALRGSAH